MNTFQTLCQMTAANGITIPTSATYRDAVQSFRQDTVAPTAAPAQVKG